MFTRSHGAAERLEVALAVWPIALITGALGAFTFGNLDVFTPIWSAETLLELQLSAA